MRAIDLTLHNLASLIHLVLRSHEITPRLKTKMAVRPILISKSVQALRSLEPHNCSRLCFVRFSSPSGILDLEIFICVI
jgi:hypothetical protein